MAFGDDPLGSVPMGYVPPATEIPAVRSRQKALFFDATTRDFPIEDDGRYVATDPATAACQAALYFLRRRIPSAPTNGNTLDEVNPYDPRALAQADNAVRTALAHVAACGWISDIRVRIRPLKSGGHKTEVTVFNHLLEQDVPVT